jgi:DNA replication protein DnaC/transposase
MAFREVTMLEIKEVLLLWLEGTAKKAIARQVGIARNTVREYIKAGLECGLSPETSGGSLTEAQLAAVLKRLRAPPAELKRGDSWGRCEQERTFIKGHLDEGVLLSKVHRLLKRKGVQVPYATLHRFAVKELNFGSAKPTIPVADCEPGEEVQLDTGWMTLLEPDLFGKRRKFRAWIFTSVYSRHRFVYPCFSETTVTAIEACEAAWAYFGEAHAHVAVVGPVGVGKTFLAHALGHVACRRGYSVLARRADLMLKTLRHARLDNTYEAELRKLIAVDLLIVDDFGLDKMDAVESRDAYEIFTERHRAGSMIVTSNRGPDEWLATFADPMRAQSAIDRFTGNAYDLVVEGESYRPRQKPTLRGASDADAPAPTKTKRHAKRSASEAQA